MEWFLPREAADLEPDALRRARLVVSGSMIVAVAFVCVALMEALAGTPWVAVTYAIAGGLMALVPLVQRATGSLQVGVNALLFVITSLVAVLALATGGARIGALYGACIVPLAAALLGGVRAGILWSAAVFGVLGAVAVGVALGVPFPAPDPQQGGIAALRGSIVLSLSVLAAALTYEWTKNRALREMSAALAKVQEERRKRAESEQRLALVLDATTEGMWDWDIPSGDLQLNQRWYETLGYAEDDFPPHLASWEALVHPDDREAVQRALDEHLAGRTPIAEAEYRLQTASGGWLLSLIRGKVVERDADGAPLRMVGVDVDITERKRAQEILQQARKLESLGVLAGGIAHDFNNLLVGIQGNAELARLGLPAGSPVLESILDIEHAGRQAAELSTQLLIYAGGGQRRIERVDLAGLVEAAARLLGTRFPRVKAVCNAEGPAPWIDADAVQIHQVIVNLLVNAAEALDDNAGSVSVRTGVMHADADYLADCYVPLGPDEGDYAYVEVRDDGCGMTEETVARIFDPFFTTKFAGRGLGLASALGVVRGHGGTLRVDTLRGRGTTFRLLFPQMQAGEPIAPSAEPVSRMGRGTILVVDDDETVLRVADRMLERAGYQSVTSDSGLDAVAKVAARPAEFSVVLLDVTMPELGGAETFDLLREIRPDLPVLFFSGHSKEAGARLAASRSGTAFVQKPFTLSELTTKLDELMSVAAEDARD